MVLLVQHCLVLHCGSLVRSCLLLLVVLLLGALFLLCCHLRLLAPGQLERCRIAYSVIWVLRRHLREGLLGVDDQLAEAHLLDFLLLCLELGVCVLELLSQPLHLLFVVRLHLLLFSVEQLVNL